MKCKLIGSASVNSTEYNLIKLIEKRISKGEEYISMNMLTEDAYANKYHAVNKFIDMKILKGKQRLKTDGRKYIYMIDKVRFEAMSKAINDLGKTIPIRTYERFAESR